MLRKTVIALLAVASVGLAVPPMALARDGGGGGGGGGGHGGGYGEAAVSTAAALAAAASMVASPAATMAAWHFVMAVSAAVDFMVAGSTMTVALAMTATSDAASDLASAATIRTTTMRLLSVRLL